MTRTDPALTRLVNGALLVPFTGDTAPGWVLQGIADGLGGVCLFAINGNITGPGRLAKLTTALGGEGEPFISIDEEGGDVTRLHHETGSPYPGNAALGVVDDTELTRAVHRSIGHALGAAGINLDYAPVADINTEPDNPVIGIRSFGAEPGLVARHTAAAVCGLQEAGVAACAKHFPGHGATRQDSHHELPTVDIGLDLLDRREFAPFRAAVEAGTRAVMTAHVRVPTLTGDDPATLSPAAVTGVLRERMGFDGVVVSDALEMRAISDTVGIPEGAVRSLAAGADLLCLGAAQGSEVVRAVRDAVVDAVRTGRLPATRLEEAADRLRRLRKWLAAAQTSRPGGDLQNRGGQGGGDLDGAVGLVAARRAVRLIGRPGPLRSPLVVEVEAPPTIAAGPLPWGFAPWFPEADVVRVDPAAVMAENILLEARDRSLVIVVRDAHRHEETRTVVSALLAARPDATVVEMGLPVWRPRCAAYLSTYGSATANTRAAADVLRSTGRPTAP